MPSPFSKSPEQLGIVVSDLEAEVDGDPAAFFPSADEPALAEARTWDGRIAELLEPTSMSRKSFAEVSDASANWDGKTDSIRHLPGHATGGAFELQTLAQRVARWLHEKI